jgi:hypothetical protein
MNTSKGPRKNKFAFFALSCGSGLVDLSEGNRSNSNALSGILQLRISQRWPANEI